MSARTAEAEILWDQLHTLGQEAETLAALFRARPELLTEALVLAVQAEGARFGPVERATRIATAWEAQPSGDHWLRFDLLRNAALGDVRRTMSGFRAVVYLEPDEENEREDLGAWRTLEEAQALVDRSLTSREADLRWILR